MPALTQAQQEFFWEYGFLVAEDVLDPEQDLQPLREEYYALLDGLIEQWYAEGKLTQTFADQPFGQRLMSVIRESDQSYYQPFDISLPQADIKPDTPIHTGPAVFNLLRSPRLLDAVESLIGPEIYSNPVQHVRIKPPERVVPKRMDNALVTRTDWHQDSGVVLPESDESDILTVWLPITEATVKNGCLVVAPGTHRGELLPHCPAYGDHNQVHIPEKYRAGGAVPAEMQPGDVLFMHRRTAHASLENTSDDIRWSFDLRYNPTGQKTGRPWFPGFVARSRAHPEQELTRAEDWTHLWHATRAHLASVPNPTFNRWSTDSPYCA